MSFIAAAAAAGTTVAAMQAAAVAGTTAAQIAAAAIAAAEAAAAAAAAAAVPVGVAGASATFPTAIALAEGAATGIAPGLAGAATGVAPGAAGALAPTALTVGSGTGATGGGLGGILAPTGLTVGSGTGATGTGGAAVAGGGGGLGGTGGIAAFTPIAEGAGQKIVEQGGRKLAERSVQEIAKDTGKNALGGPRADPLLSPVKPLPPIQSSTPTQNAFSRMDAFSENAGNALKNVKPSSGGNNSFSSMDAFNRNAVNNLNQGWKVGPSAPTVPAGTSSAGGEATKDAWVLALEDQGATAAQRTAMENSAKTFGDIGGKYESAITKTPVEKSLLNKAGEFVMDNKLNIALGGLGLMQMMPPESGVNPISESMIRPYTYSEEDTSDQEADPRGREKIRYSSSYAAGTPYKAAQGGLLSLHRGGNFLSGGGDGMSDDIPAMIGAKQPARLADGEFVIPADVVSHLGNGSSKAGAAKLYAMMDKIRQERTGRKRQSPQINAAKYLPR